MPEYTEIKLVWKYDGNYPKHISGCESWMLVTSGGEKIARLLRHSDEILKRVSGISRFMLMRNPQYKDLLPWRALEAGLDKDELFRLSDSGITTAEMDDVYEPVMAVRIKRQPDGSIVRVSDWIEQGER